MSVTLPGGFRVFGNPPGFRAHQLLIFAWLACAFSMVHPALGASRARPDWVVLETSLPEGTTIATGDVDLLKNRYSPASTFKIIIAWAGIEIGLLGPKTEFLCHDRHIFPGGGKLGLHEAMFRSSNDYFVQAARRIGVATISRFLERSGLASDGAALMGFETGSFEIVKGGRLKVTPARLHAFMVGIASERLTMPRETRTNLLESLAWPSSVPSVRLFGKTGSLRGSVWFTGFGAGPDGKKVVTVFIRGGITRREEAVSRFLQRFGQVP